MTTGYAQRIRTLREKSGKTAAELAQLLGVSDMGYFDLELHDDELPMVVSLEQIRRLADALGVSTLVLLLEDAVVAPASRISYTEMVERARQHMASTGLTQAQLENQIGWTLDDCFESEQKMLASYNLDFLKSISAALGVRWQETIQ